jgi:uncharacterized protein (UPF0264 family)
MKLLVSVRSAEEALAALEGGADVIDIKEPARGSLGRADDAIIAATLQVVAGRRTVSAACGELLEANPSATRPQGQFSLSYVKWGLAGCARHADWPQLLAVAARALPANCRPVAVAYADWQRAESPSPENVCAFTCEQSWGAFLIDTWRKDGTILLDALPLARIEQLVQHCREARMLVALAGSLGELEIKKLLPLAPDWIAVRGSACRDGDRGAVIDAARVRRLVSLCSHP